jgi:hypothetical protein
MKPTTIKEHRKRFRAAPLGVWSTFEAYPCGAAVEFYENHVGLVHFFWGLGGEELAFEWRERSDWVIEIRPFPPTDVPDPEHSTEEAPEDDANVWGEWELVRYDFKTVPWYGREQVVLFQMHSKFKSFWGLSGDADWFWQIHGPIYYVGPTRTPTPISPLPAPPPPDPIPAAPETGTTYRRFRFALLVGLAGGVFGFLVFLQYGLEQALWMSLIVAVLLTVWTWFDP